MSSGFTTFILIVGCIVACYYLILFIAFRKKLQALFGKTHLSPALQMQAGAALSEFPYQLIDRPLMQQDAEITLSLDRPEEVELEMVEDEDSHLLKAAEIVVEKIQDVVSHIASNPPNPEEVFTKIRAIVSQYSIFFNTDYFDAINSFISITVERDCALQFSKEQLLDLWK